MIEWRKSWSNSPGAGVALTALLHLAAIAIKGTAWLPFIAVAQCVYMIPAVLVAVILRKGSIVMGMLIATGVTFMIGFTLCVTRMG